MIPVLNADQRCALHVLAYLWFRMGRLQSAKRAFRVLADALPADEITRKAAAGLAAIALAENDASAALRHVNAALEGCNITSRMGFLYLLRGQALWLQGRHDEARNALAQYEYLAGESENA